MDIARAACMLGCCVNTVKNMIDDGLLVGKSELTPGKKYKTWSVDSSSVGWLIQDAKRYQHLPRWRVESEQRVMTRILRISPEEWNRANAELSEYYRRKDFLRVLIQFWPFAELRPYLNGWEARHNWQNRLNIPPTICVKLAS